MEALKASVAAAKKRARDGDARRSEEKARSRAKA